MKKIKPGILIGSLLLPLAIGCGSALLTQDAMKQYHFMNKPPLSPPEWVFPAVWTILYLLMGLACYIMFTADSTRNRSPKALLYYGIYLVMNFFWTLIFFNASEYLLSFIWLIVMLIILVIMTVCYFKISKKAGLLLLPLLIWTAFAGYLNLSIYILSRTPAILHK